jgi:hypothetical protein
MAPRKNRAQKPASAVESVAADNAAVDGDERTLVDVVRGALDGEFNDAPAVTAHPETADDMPRWMKYRIKHGLPIDDAPAGDA